MTKTCRVCKREDPECGFSPTEYRCRECCRKRAKEYYQRVKDRPEFKARNRAKAGAWAETHPALANAKATRQRLKNYGLTPESYAEAWEAQGGLCAICGSPEIIWHGQGVLRQLAIDHDHKCCPKLGACDKCRRDLLCFSCNTALGRLEANWDAATAYLQKHGVLY